MWCITIWMAAMSAGSKAPSRKQEIHNTRVSVSFPAELYETLESLAKEKRVSLAWVVRDAAAQYVTEQWPLLGPPTSTSRR